MGETHEDVPKGEGPWLQVREEVEVWEMGTNVKVEQRAPRLATSFKGTRGILAKKWILANKEAAKKADGVKELLDYLEAKTAGESSWNRFDAYCSFIDMKRSKGESMDAYLNRVEVSTATLEGMKVDVRTGIMDELTAMLILHRAGIGESDKRAVLTAAFVAGKLNTEKLTSEMRRLFPSQGEGGSALVATAEQVAAQEAKKLDTLGSKLKELEALVGKGGGKGKNNKNKDKDKKPVDVTKIKCFNCREMGHYARECTKPKTAAAASSDQDPKKTGAVAVGQDRAQEVDVSALQQYAASMLDSGSDFRARP